MKRSMYAIVAAATVALTVGMFASRLVAQPPGPMMGGGPGMMGGHEKMAGAAGPGCCCGMAPEPPMGPGMGMGMMPLDQKSQAQLMQLRGKTMQLWGEWMEKRGKELEQQAK